MLRDDAKFDETLTIYNEKMYLRWKDEIDLLRGLKTPFVAWSSAKIRDNIRLYNQGLDHRNVTVRYAMKSCTIRNVVELARTERLQIDCQSLREVRLARQCGFAYSEIALSSPGLSKSEIEWAATHQVKVIVNCKEHIECLLELGLPSTQKFGLRLSVNVPSTQRFWEKFGMSVPEVINFFDKRPASIQIFDEIHHHGAARLTSAADFHAISDAFTKGAARIERKLNHQFAIVNFGGGLEPESILVEFGTNTKDLIKVCDQTIADNLGPQPRRIVFEPGRAITKDASCAVGSVKLAVTSDRAAVFYSDIGTNCLVPLPLSEFRLVVAIGVTEKIEGNSITLADGTCSPAGVVSRESSQFLPQPGSIVVVGLTGAYTWSLIESFCDYIPRALWIDHNGTISEMFSAANARLVSDLSFGGIH